MGRDVRALLKHDPALLTELTDHLLVEIGKTEDSRLIQQILEADRLKRYEEVHNALMLLARELSH
jgi:hypothetical protein